MNTINSAVRILDNLTKQRYLREILPCLLPLLLAGQLIAWIVLLPGGLRGLADFRQLYAAGYMVRTGNGHDLYNYEAQKRFQNQLVAQNRMAVPFIRPAYQALFFVPLSLLSYREAYLVFLVFNICLLGFCYLLLRSRLKNLAGYFSWLPLALFLSFLPVSIALLQGQDTIILMTLLAAAMVLQRRNRDFFAGFLIGLGLFKLQVVLPIFVLFIAGRRWRFASGFAGSAILVTVVSDWVLAFAPIGSSLAWLWSVGSGAASRTGAVEIVFDTSFMPNLRGLISGLIGGVLPTSYLQIVTLAISGTTFLVAAIWGRVKLSRSDALVLAITASAVVTYYLLIHDLSVMLLPILAILDRSMEAGDNQMLLDRLSAWLATFLLVAPMCIFILPHHFYVVSLPLLGLLGTLLFSSNRIEGGRGPVENDPWTPDVGLAQAHVASFRPNDWKSINERYIELA